MQSILNYDLPAPPLRTWRSKHGPRRLAELDPSRDMARLPSPGPHTDSPRQGPKSIRLAQLNPELVRRLDEARPKEDGLPAYGLSRSPDLAYLRDPVRLPGDWASSSLGSRASQGMGVSPPAHCRAAAPEGSPPQPFSMDSEATNLRRICHRGFEGSANEERQRYLCEIRELRQRCAELAETVQRLQLPRPRFERPREGIRSFLSMQELHNKIKHSQQATMEVVFRAWQFRTKVRSSAALPEARWRRQAALCCNIRDVALLRMCLATWIMVSSESRSGRIAEEQSKLLEALQAELHERTAREDALKSQMSEAHASAQMRIQQLEASLREEQARSTFLEAQAARTPRSRNLSAGTKLISAMDLGFSTAVFCAWRTALENSRALGVLRSKQLAEEATRTGMLQAQARESEARLRECEGRYMELLQSTRAELSEQESRHQEALAQQQAEASMRLAQVESDLSNALRAVCTDDNLSARLGEVLESLRLRPRAHTLEDPLDVDATTELTPTDAGS